ncbi:transcriptional regulator [Serratia sp. UGAL515B_01]|uniref:winged helix-turn-helix domain-containing protein n=1 Tax=Serratia sp. UGAL515B_01 TaxID=2986763 RepID=UPI0029555668|nr:winged helix-turn-helix domain-containing protein [Serratia sp. UGAL515B_01]WON77735.1 winged helix-turn-helix domain-containing protein [Serratia sp. UGAL515B_01]
MKDKFIINDMVVYHPDQHRLTPLGSRGKETALNVPSSRCLLLMLQRPGLNITQEEFFREVWEKHGQYVTANTFYQNISLIRKGIRNAGIRNPVIRTLPKIGLCFTGTVQIISQESNESDNSIEQSEDSNQSPHSVTQPEVVSGTKTDAMRYTGTEFSASETDPSTIFKKITDTHTLRSSLFRRWRIPFIATITLVLFGLSSSVYHYILYPTLSVSQSTDFFGEHMRIFTVNQCDVFINRLENNLNRERFLSSLESKKVSCNPNEFIYITNSPVTIKRVIMRCQAFVDSSLRCETIYSFI